MSGKWEEAAPVRLAGETPEANWMRQVVEAHPWIDVAVLAKASHAMALGGTQDTKDAPPKWLEKLHSLGSGVNPDDKALAKLMLQKNQDAKILLDLRVAASEASVLEEIVAEAGNDLISITGCRASLEGARDAKVPENDELALADGPFPDGSVLMVILDDGIGIANRRFWHSEQKTRILAFRDMDHDGCSPNGDRIFTAAQIDKNMQACGDDETAFYQEHGMIDVRSSRRQPLRRLRTHGTHVLDLFAGYDYNVPSERETARTRPIIAVQLPSRTVEERSDVQMEGALRRALKWVLLKTMELNNAQVRAGGKALPLVVNFSFGVFAGPKDGGGAIERLLDDFIETSRLSAPCEVVVPAGNGYASQSSARLALGSPGTPCPPLVLKVQPDDRTPSFVEIWAPLGKENAQSIEVRVRPSRSRSAGRSVLGHHVDWIVNGDIQARLYHQIAPRAEGGQREVVTLALRPTADAGGDPTACPSGPWEIEVRNISNPEGTTVDLFVQRDDPVSFRPPTGRQSSFQHPQYVRHTETDGRPPENDVGPVTRARTLNAYASGLHTVIAGGHRASDGKPASYSAAGPTANARSRPTLSAAAEDSAQFQGKLASGTLSGTVFRLTGTSVAAPLAARAIADRLSEPGTVGQLLADAGKTDRLNVTAGVWKKGDQDRVGIARLVEPVHPAPRRRRDR